MSLSMIGDFYGTGIFLQKSRLRIRMQLIKLNIKTKQLVHPITLPLLKSFRL